MSKVAWRDRLLPDSIVARMSVVLFAGILLAQALGAGLWAQQIKQSERQRLAQISTNLGSRIGQTAQFFTRLPKQLIGVDVAMQSQPWSVRGSQAR